MSKLSIPPELLAKARKHKFRCTLCLDTEAGGIINHRCETLKLTRIVETPRTNGHYGEQVVWYKIDGDETEYDDLLTVLRTLEERQILT